MITLNSKQEEAFFVIASRMDTHEQDGFYTIAGGGNDTRFIRIYFLPSQPRKQVTPLGTPLQYAYDNYQRAIWSLRNYFDDMRMEYEGAYEGGPLTPEGARLYNELVGAKILNYLKGKLETQDYDVNNADIGVSSKTFESILRLLIIDKSIGEEIDAHAEEGTNPRTALYITSKGERRVETGIYDLTIDPDPQPVAIQPNNASSKETQALTYVPTDIRVPESVRVNVDEAKHCLSFGAVLASAVMARRTIQAICVDKGVSPRKKLEHQIDELATNSLITNSTRDRAHTVRWIGNDAAHITAYTVTSKDAEDAIELVDLILKEVYVSLAIVQEQRMKRNKLCKDRAASTLAQRQCPS